MTIKVEMSHTPDLNVIAAIHDACFEKGWSAEAIHELLAATGTMAFVAKDKSGFALIRLIAGEAEVLTICVLEARRRKGVAGRLVEAVCVWLAAQKAESVFLEVNEHNEAAKLLYEHHGFSVVARRHEYYRNADGSHEHALVMRRSFAVP